MSRLNNVDLRKTGSGNLGTTNSVRAMGIKKGLIIFFADALKAAAAFFVCKGIFCGSGIGVIAGFYGGAGAILGHDFPFFLKFKGGKGFAAHQTGGGNICDTAAHPPLVNGAVCMGIVFNNIEIVLAGNGHNGIPVRPLKNFCVRNPNLL